MGGQKNFVQVSGTCSSYDANIYDFNGFLPFAYLVNGIITIY